MRDRCRRTRMHPTSCPNGCADTVVPAHDLSAEGDVLERVGALAGRAVAEYDPSPDTRIELLNVSENATFAVEGPKLGFTVLRVHRLGYHDQDAIESELDWMQALRSEAGLRTPAVIPASDGRRVVVVHDAEAGEVRH